MAQRVAEGPPAPLYLGGASFGGAVALEVARQLRPRAVFLIGSCRGAGAIPPLYRLLGRLARPLPTVAYAALARVAPCGFSLFGPATAAQRDAFLAQMAGTPPSFLRWGIDALLRWTPGREWPRPVFQIHGGRDRILPCRRAFANVVIPDAGHLVNVTHAAEVNRFILDRLGE